MLVFPKYPNVKVKSKGQGGNEVNTLPLTLTINDPKQLVIELDVGEEVEMPPDSIRDIRLQIIGVDTIRITPLQDDGNAATDITVSPG